MKRPQRNALNRGTAVHLGNNSVRFVWACMCQRVEKLTAQGRPLSSEAVAQLVRNWRHNGVVLEQCQKHPDHYEPKSPLERLNKENPA